MSNNNVEPEEFERFYADAVCEQCGSVNPEGTLLCKTCGNNLRDQRMRRVREKGPEEAGRGRRLHFRWVATILYAVLMFGVIFAAISYAEIEAWFTRALTGATWEVSSYWSGPESEVYKDLLTRLRVNPLTNEQAENAERTVAYDNGYTGRYAVKLKRVGRKNPVIGQAIVRQDGDRLYFVGLAINGFMEIRGTAEVEEDGRISVEESVGAKRQDGAPFSVYAYATRREDGGIECYGVGDPSGRGFTVLAYRVP